MKNYKIYYKISNNKVLKCDSQDPECKNYLKSTVYKRIGPICQPNWNTGGLEDEIRKAVNINEWFDKCDDL